MQSSSLWVEYPRLFSVTVSEAAVRRGSIKKFAKFGKTHRKMPVSESLFQLKRNRNK